jgi:hypothetical protein
MPRGALKSSLLLVGTLGMAEVPEEAAALRAPTSVRPDPDAGDLVGTVQRFASAWLGGRTEAMYQCLHPDLPRLILGQASLAAPEALRRIMGVQALLGRASGGRPGEVEVRVLDVQGRTGSARVDLGPWTAFIHLAAHRGGWAIANVLWEWRR